MNKDSWEKEFDKRFSEEGDEDLKIFISEALSKQKSELDKEWKRKFDHITDISTREKRIKLMKSEFIELLEGVRIEEREVDMTYFTRTAEKDYDKDYIIQCYKDNEYNQAVSEINKRLELTKERVRNEE